MSNSLPPHGLQHTRLLCPPLSPRVCWNSCPLSGWCYWTISSSAAPFCCYLQSFPASGSCPISRPSREPNSHVRVTDSQWNQNAFWLTHIFTALNHCTASRAMLAEISWKGVKNKLRNWRHKPHFLFFFFFCLLFLKILFLPFLLCFLLLELL